MEDPGDHPPWLLVAICSRVDSHLLGLRVLTPRLECRLQGSCSWVSISILPVRLWRQIVEARQTSETISPPTKPAPSHDVARRVSNYLFVLASQRARWSDERSDCGCQPVVAHSLRHRNPNDLHYLLRTGRYNTEVPIIVSGKSYTDPI